VEDGVPARPSYGVALMVDRFKLVLDAVPYEIERQGNLLLVEGQEFPYKIKGNSVTVQGNTHTVEISGNTATVDGVVYPFEAMWHAERKTEKTRKTATFSAAGQTGAITAIMPGLIIKVLKKEGDRIEAGEVVLILEAMKMQNELRANRSGVIKKLNVREGDSVEMRQILAIIE
jgi:biotin carboxyl carrier protein